MSPFNPWLELTHPMTDDQKHKPVLGGEGGPFYSEASLPLPSEPAPVDGEYSSLGLKSPTHPAAAWQTIAKALEGEAVALTTRGICNTWDHGKAQGIRHALDALMPLASRREGA